MKDLNTQIFSLRRQIDKAISEMKPKTPRPLKIRRMEKRLLKLLHKQAVERMMSK